MQAFRHSIQIVRAICYLICIKSVMEVGFFALARIKRGKRLLYDVTCIAKIMGETGNIMVTATKKRALAVYGINV
ncbi:hypothetical protein A6J65_018440 [Yersinia enterocolitica]|nr:hypothetical protein A6J65_018440 [Yersinia enterocolitica]